jgi:hypothetical protein
MLLTKLLKKILMLKLLTKLTKLSVWFLINSIELYETMLTRHTTMVVGPTGGIT